MILIQRKKKQKWLDCYWGVRYLEKKSEGPKSSPKKVLEIFRSEFSFPSEEENTGENEDKKIMRAPQFLHRSIVRIMNECLYVQAPIKFNSRFLYKLLL